MELYEHITRIMEVGGMTFDEAFTWFVIALLGFVGGVSFLFSFVIDLGCYLYRGLEKLLRFIIRRLRRRWEGEP